MGDTHAVQVSILEPIREAIGIHLNVGVAELFRFKRRVVAQTALQAITVKNQQRRLIGRQ